MCTGLIVCPAVDDAIALRIVRAWVAAADEQGCTVDLPATGGTLARELGLCCERVGLHPTGNWRIFDWVTVLGALLQVQRQGLPLLPGRVVLGIEEYGAVALEVDGDQARCEHTTDAPCLQLPASTAMRLLFGPLPPGEVASLPRAAAVLAQWCPLPLFWPRQDGV